MYEFSHYILLYKNEDKDKTKSNNHFMKFYIILF